ncbi:MAG: hypothetical protein LBQ16_07260, partial [Gracilibacteraceae bacterium]|nr:hypothetical protein [Gracilibacteraceae bacterium]
AVLVTPPDLGHAISLHAIINKNPQIFNVNNSIKWKNCQARLKLFSCGVSSPEAAQEKREAVLRQKSLIQPADKRSSGPQTRRLIHLSSAKV